MPYLDKQWLENVWSELEKLEESVEKKRLVEELDGLMKQHGIIKSLVFTKNFCERIEALLGENELSKMLTNCSCQHPDEQLQELKSLYNSTKSIDAVRLSLKKEFEYELITYYDFTKSQIEFIRANDWGPAGVLRDNKLCITKVPDQFREHFQSTDSLLKTAYYCHCNRIKEGLKFGFNMPASYCKCGVGYYKKMWSEILGEEVKVEQVKSVLADDSVCQFVIILPE